MALSLKISGVTQALKNLQAIFQEVPHEAAAALYQEAELIMTDSKKEIPVDTGAARDSGFVEEPVKSLLGAKVSLGYGGVATKINMETGEPTSVYLTYLHEDLKAKHLVGKAKFLEDPAKAHAKELERRVRIRIKNICEKKRAV